MVAELEETGYDVLVPGTQDERGRGKEFGFLDSNFLESLDETQSSLPIQVY